ncbi:MAG: cytochrome c [Azonexus sp.]|nr:cytochrome c [Azonexus sp.]
MRQLFATCLLTLHAGMLLAQDAQGKPGAGIYATHCVACHQPDGQGAPGVAPPLAGNVGRHAGNPEGRNYLARVPLVGMVGTITVDGVRYLGNNMPSFSALSDADIASVVGYVLRDFNGVADLSWLTPDFVAGVRQSGGTPNETHKQRGRLPVATGG